MGAVINCERYVDDEEYDKLNIKIRISSQDLDKIRKTLLEDRSFTLRTDVFEIDVEEE